MAKLVNIVDHYGDDSPSASDQEELVGATDFDDDLTDVDDIPYNNYCNKQTNDQSLNGGGSDSGVVSGNEQQQLQQQSTNCNEQTSKCRFFGSIVALFIATFALLICTPLYLQQLAVEGKKNNAYGAILFNSTAVAAIFIVAAAIVSYIAKWDIKLYKCPISWKRATIISTCSGIAGTLCIVSSYQRVPCHLQDPLKGAALVYSLVFYFFFCRKVMGLQRLFSATTAVVGLFISVDYGLCDEFRCRGSNIIATAPLPTVGWQGRAMWTLVYVAGIALWTLHLSLLEGNIVTPVNIPRPNNCNNFLSTVSRIVSSSDPMPIEPPKIKIHKPKLLHMAAWIHAISFIISITLGWIDIIPGAGPIEPIAKFWHDTGSTFLCHLNIRPNDVPELRDHQSALEFLSNLTPNSYLYNQTVQKLRRNKRSTTDKPENHTHSHKKINSRKDGAPMELPSTTTNNHNNNNNNNKHQHHSPNENQIIHQHQQQLHSNKTAAANHNNHNNGHHTANQTQMTAAMLRKINTEKYWKKLKNYTKYKHKIIINSHNQTPMKVSTLILNTNGRDDCGQLSIYSLLAIAVYIAFIICLYNFLFISESAVYTVAVLSAALPVSGIFWSVFELTTMNNMATILWSPKVTGELICSLLGTPIVLLGIGLLTRAHFFAIGMEQFSSKSIYTSLTSRDS